MAVNSVTLVLDLLDPVLVLDAEIGGAVNRAVEAQVALQGWSDDSITDQQKVYIALLSLRFLIPRLLLKFAQKVKKAQGGSAMAEYDKAISYLETLQQTLTEQIRVAAHEVDPTDILDDLTLVTLAWSGGYNLLMADLQLAVDVERRIRRGL